jgi:hypothetical protein
MNKFKQFLFDDRYGLAALAALVGLVIALSAIAHYVEHLLGIR